MARKVDDFSYRCEPHLPPSLVHSLAKVVILAEEKDRLVEPVNFFESCNATYDEGSDHVR